MKITYISHSGFAVETENYLLIFDYFEGKLPVMKPNKKVIFFASHRHSDHFSNQIYQYIDSASYVLSRDIYDLPSKNYIRVKHRETYEFEGIQIETLKSNDEGVAFIVTVDNRVIYHAGDLNFWYWQPDNQEDILENNTLEKRYRKEIESISRRSFDVAFIPLDPRLKEAASWGMKLFLEKCKVNTVFPMHMWKDYSIIESCKCNELEEWKNIIQDIRVEGQEFEVE